MSAQVLPLRRPPTTVTDAAEQALTAIGTYLDRCALADNTRRAYKRHCAAYTTWIAAHATEHPDAFRDRIGAEGAVTAWRKHLIEARTGSANINQALVAVSLLYEQGRQLSIRVKRVRIPRAGEPDALTPAQQGAVERAAARRGDRDAAIIAVLLYAGARVEECARLDLDDVAVTARTGRIRLHGKGDQVREVPLPARARDRISAWQRERGNQPGPLWTGQRGPLSISGLTQVVLAVGQAANLPGLRPHRLRHTYATRLRQGGADPAQIQALLGHGSIESTARYFRAGADEQAAVIQRIFDT